MKYLLMLKDPKLYGALRHLISTVGGVLAYRGVVATSEWELYSGLGMAVFAVLLSAMAPEKRK